MRLQDEGKVRLIGVCGAYDIRILAALSKARKVQVVQNRWYEGNEWDQKVFNYCKDSEIMYQCVGDLSFTLHEPVSEIPFFYVVDRSGPSRGHHLSLATQPWWRLQKARR